MPKGEFIFMSVMRVHKNSNFTVMSNYHFKEKGMSLKAKGLLSLMLSLPDDWNYTVSGLVTLSKDGKDGVMAALVELEKMGYLTRERTTNSKGQFNGIEYNIYEQPQRDIPIAEKPILDKPNAEMPTQLNTNQLNKDILNTEIIYILDNQVRNGELRLLFTEYLQLREGAISASGLVKLIERCERLANKDVELQKAMVEAAIINNWKNVYLPNEQDAKNNSTIATKKRFYNL